MAGPNFVVVPKQSLFEKFPVEKLLNTDSSEGFCELQNSVHPLVKKSNWDNQVNYDAILSALKLLSHFLSTEQMLTYVDMLFFQPHVEFTDPRTRSGRAFRMYPKESPLTAEEKKAAEECLVYQATIKDFRVVLANEKERQKGGQHRTPNNL
jgi:hypothetical protein